MAHSSGNPAWVDYPSQATLITAESLENIENKLDQLAAAPAPPRVLGPYMGGGYTALPAGGGGRTAGTCVVPDPGFAWYPLAFAHLEVRVLAVGSRASAVVCRSSITAANEVAHGTGLDPINQAAGGNGWWLITATPRWGAAKGDHLIPSGASALARTFILAPSREYGSAQIECTDYYASLIVFVVPA